MTGGGYFPGRYFSGRYFTDHYFPNGIETGAGVVAPAFIASSTHVFDLGVERNSVEPGLIDQRARVLRPEVSIWVPVTVYIGGGTALPKPKKSFIEVDFLFGWTILHSVETEYAFVSSIRGLVDADIGATWAVEGGLVIESEMGVAWHVRDLDQKTKDIRNLRFLLSEMDEDLAEVLW